MQMRIMDESRKIVDYMYEKGDFKECLTANIRSRIPVFAINTREEQRLLHYLTHLSNVQGQHIFVWDIISGMIDHSELMRYNNKVDPINLDTTQSVSSEHEKVLAYINEKYEYMGKFALADCKRKGVTAEIFVLFDFKYMLKNPRIIRRLKTFLNSNSIANIILVGDDISKDMSREMRREIVSLHTPNAGEEEFSNLIDDIMNGAINVVPELTQEVSTNKQKILKSIKGKTIAEAQNLLSHNLVTHRSFLDYRKQKEEWT